MTLYYFQGGRHRWTNWTLYNNTSNMLPCNTWQWRWCFDCQFFFFKDCGDLRAITCFCLLAKLMQISTWSFQVKKEQEFQNFSPCWSTYIYLSKTPCLEYIIRFQNHGFLTLFWSALWCSKKFLIPDIARSKSLPHYRDANTPEGIWSKDF